jgi:predicted phosphoribosyltransferase
MTVLPFRDRSAAGEMLADTVVPSLSGEPCTVLAIPRGGVPVAVPVARALDAPLGLVVPRKVSAPGQPELAMGAVAPGGIRVLDRALIAHLGVGEDRVSLAVENAEREAAVRLAAYGRIRLPPIAGRTIVIVDDGIATGSTAVAAIRWARAHGAGSVALAAPVAPPGVITDLAGEADRIFVVETPSPFVAVGRWYERFEQTTDAEVTDALAGGG